MYHYYNPNPEGRNVGDCSVRAVSKALCQDWDTTYWGLALEGALLRDMPSANAVWGAYLARFLPTPSARRATVLERNTTA